MVISRWFHQFMPTVSKEPSRKTFKNHTKKQKANDSHLKLDIFLQFQISTFCKTEMETLSCFCTAQHLPDGAEPAELHNLGNFFLHPCWKIRSQKCPCSYISSYLRLAGSNILSLRSEHDGCGCLHIFNYRKISTPLRLPRIAFAFLCIRLFVVKNCCSFFWSIAHLK